MKPWFGPAPLETATDYGGVNLLSVEVEQRELPARLLESPSQVEDFM
jgi:hypothetical protein